jgi:flagellar motility protein MotE (MotC chaperone)
MPVLIVAALCMLGFRIQVVVRSVTVEPATAFAQAQPAPAAEAEAPAEGDPAATDGGENAEDGAGTADGDGASPMALTPSNLTASEIETLQRLAERREIIESRERELQQKESLVQAAEQRLDQKIAQLQDIEKQLQDLVGQYDVKKKSEIEQLVRIYTAMKPKDAARIFDDLDMAIPVSVVANMKEAKVAPIISAMNADKARALTEEMSSRRDFADMAGGTAPTATP